MSIPSPTTAPEFDRLGPPGYERRLAVLRRLLRFAALAASGLLLGTGCAAALPHPSAATAARAQGRWPDSSLAQLEQGRSVFAQRCSGCHALPLPDSRSEPEWKKVLDEMGAEAKLTAGERVLVERFLLSVRTRQD